MIRQIICGLLALLILSGCQNRTRNKLHQEAIYQYAQQASPSDAGTAEQYQRSCQTCHAKGLGGAPLPGDKTVWQTMLKKRGIDGLVENTVNGVRGMPPMGQCFDCNRENFEALIRFMMKSYDEND